MRHVKAILWKQCKDTLKNKTILIQFIMFPLMTLIMENAIEMQDMPPHFFANLFAVMYVGMAPLTSIASILAEEKEKNTLRVLRFSGVKGKEYLFGNGIYVFAICMLGSLVIGAAGGYRSKQLLTFVGIMAMGHIISILVGAAIGVMSKNQMSATSMTIPVMMIFSFLPMLSMFNETISKVAKFVYTRQLSLLLNQVHELTITGENALILAVNILLGIILFSIAYRKVFW